MTKPAVRQSDRDVIVNACAKVLDESVNIANIRRVVDTSLAFDSLPNTDVAIACDLVASLKAQGRVVVAGDVESQCKKTDCRVLWPVVLL